MKTVAFVRGGPSLRIYNQALALKQSNRYKSIFICRMLDKNSIRLFSKAFDKIIFFWRTDIRSKLNKVIRKSSILYDIGEKFLFLYAPLEHRIESIKFKPFLKQIDADAYNCLIRPYGLAHTVIKHTKKPIIFDAYDFDGIMHGIENLAKVVYNREKYCFEHASGVIHRGPEFEIDYYKTHGYKIDCPTLPYFLDYCNKEFFVNGNVKKLSEEDGEYHLVHIGSGIPYEFVSWLKEASKQRIHFHLYAHTGIKPKAFKEIINLRNKTGYVHFETPVPFDKINHVIAKYDFGTFINLPGVRTYKTKIGLNVLHAHRIFNYLEAGLPIIVTDCLELIKKIVVENEIGFSLKDDEADKLRSNIEKYNYEVLRENVLKTREKLLIDNHAERLVKFYDNIIQR